MSRALVWYVNLTTRFKISVKHTPDWFEGRELWHEPGHVQNSEMSASDMLHYLSSAPCSLNSGNIQFFPTYSRILSCLEFNLGHLVVDIMAYCWVPPYRMGRRIRIEMWVIQFFHSVLNVVRGFAISGSLQKLRTVKWDCEERAGIGVMQLPVSLATVLRQESPSLSEDCRITSQLLSPSADVDIRINSHDSTTSQRPW